MKIKHITPRTLDKLIESDTKSLFLCGDGIRHHFVTIDLMPILRNAGDKVLDLQVKACGRDKFQYYLEKTEKTDIIGYSTFLHAIVTENIDTPHVLYLKHSPVPTYTEDFKRTLGALPQDDPILYNLESTSYLYMELCLVSDIALLDKGEIYTLVPELKEALKPVSSVVYFYIHQRKPNYFYYLFKTYVPEKPLQYNEFIGKLAEISDKSKGICSLIPDNISCELCHYHIPKSRQHLEMGLKCQKANHDGEHPCEEFYIDFIRRCENCYFFSPIDQQCHHQNNVNIRFDTNGKLMVDYKNKPMYGSCDLWKLEGTL